MPITTTRNPLCQIQQRNLISNIVIGAGDAGYSDNGSYSTKTTSNRTHLMLHTMTIGDDYKVELDNSKCHALKKKLERKILLNQIDVKILLSLK
ncbi:hypothetical protein PVAND_008998 [Polypedilum vanderplanki]|uniref:Uncharacterized protein n=1 Tax=Polypedilum vanderplanki TaxID=319348 RepID=A0A9J6CBR1_POLVA|nr:hypothetical protein PVAND_008998 [Polypedilum vanderplanki]